MKVEGVTVGIALVFMDGVGSHMVAKGVAKGAKISQLFPGGAVVRKTVSFSRARTEGMRCRRRMVVQDITVRKD